ncbi:MAG: hypothetical protein QXO01_02395 [Nitrososphaerota archaeon]
MPMVIVLCPYPPAGSLNTVVEALIRNEELVAAGIKYTRNKFSQTK